MAVEAVIMVRINDFSGPRTLGQRVITVSIPGESKWPKGDPEAVDDHVREALKAAPPVEKWQSY